jgi:hypothetical protein
LTLLIEELYMKQIKHKYSITARFRDILKISAWIFLLGNIGFFHYSGALMGLKSASADVQYGIQGQQAPELNLTTWIDGDGKQIDPIKLSHSRGKVIYLYFFQDW